MSDPVFDFEEEWAVIESDLDTLEVDDFLKNIINTFHFNGYSAKLPDRFYDGIINLNENQKNLALVKLLDVLWKRIDDDGKSSIGVEA